MTNILLIEDDEAISAPLVRVLSREGYAVHHVTRGKDGLEVLDQTFDLLILDLGLPDMEGLNVARQARSRGLTFPILILTARSDEVDLVVGLDAGADDYITKPFRLAELLARVRALLRRMTHVNISDGMMRVQDIALSLSGRRAFRGGEELGLTGKEFELIRVLMRQAGTTVSREELMHEVWGSAGGDSTKKLDMHISWLRRKLGDEVGKPRYISTVRGVGFRFEKE